MQLAVSVASQMELQAAVCPRTGMSFPKEKEHKRHNCLDQNREVAVAVSEPTCERE